MRAFKTKATYTTANKTKAQRTGSSGMLPIFEMTFRPGVIPTGLVCTTTGTSYGYLTPEDERVGIETAFGPGVPVITYEGLRGCSAYTCYFLNSKAPVTQDITFAAAGTYTVYHYGAGNVVVSGASTGNGTDTGAGTGVKSAGLTFTTDAAGMTVSFGVSGDVDRCQVNSGAFAMPFVPVAGTPVSIASLIGKNIITSTNIMQEVFGSASGMMELDFTHTPDAAIGSANFILTFWGSASYLLAKAFSAPHRYTSNFGGSVASVITNRAGNTERYIATIEWGGGQVQLGIDDIIVTAAFTANPHIENLSYLGSAGAALVYLKSIKLYNKAKTL